MLLSLGVSSEGLPLRMGLRDGNTSDSTETPVAIEECLALGLDGVRGIVADSKAYCKRTLGLCLEQGVGLITLVPRTCAVRQEVEAWGQQHGALPLLLEKPGRTRQEPPRRWHGQSVVRRVPVEYADGRLDVAEIRFLVVHSSQLAHQAAAAYAAAQAKEAARVAEHVQHVEARWFACAADAEAAIAEYDGRGQGRRGRKPRPWRYHVLHYRVEAVSVPQKRTRRGRPPKSEAPQVEVRYRLVVHPEALVPSEDAHGWTVLATTVRPEECKQVPRSLRRNRLATKRSNGVLVMRHAHPADAWGELVQIAQTSSSTHGRLPHAPKAFARVAGRATRGGEARPAPWTAAVVAGRGECVRPRAPTPIDAPPPRWAVCRHVAIPWWRDWRHACASQGGTI